MQWWQQEQFAFLLLPHKTKAEYFPFQSRNTSDFYFVSFISSSISYEFSKQDLKFCAVKDQICVEVILSLRSSRLSFDSPALKRSMIEFYFPVIKGTEWT